MVLICANDPPDPPTEAGFLFSDLRLLGLNVGGTAPPSVLPDISPTWGEIGCHPGFRQSPASG